MAEPDVLNTVSPQLINGVMSAVAKWRPKGQETLMQRMKDEYKEPWMTQNGISTYGDMRIMKAALEKAGKGDRESMAQDMRALDEGKTTYFPGGALQYATEGTR